MKRETANGLSSMPRGDNLLPGNKTWEGQKENEIWKEPFKSSRILKFGHILHTLESMIVSFFRKSLSNKLEEIFQTAVRRPGL